MHVTITLELISQIIGLTANREMENWADLFIDH